MLAAHSLTLGSRLRDISVTFRTGEVTAICGPNGAGKSTLLSCLAGLLLPDAGSVTLGDAPLAKLPLRHRAQAIGYLPQSPEVAWDVSVEVLAGLGRLPWRTGAQQDQTAVDAALQAMELSELRHRPISQLSGGERARALAARVLAGEPRWLLADEPLANLDLAHARALIGILRDQANAGAGVVLVLHDLASAMNHADRVLVLDQGQLVADAAPAEALSATMIEQVWQVPARWLGDPGARALAVG